MHTGDKQQSDDTPPQAEVRKTTPLDPVQILKRLKELREANLLTEEEYQARIVGIKIEAHSDGH